MLMTIAGCVGSYVLFLLVQPFCFILECVVHLACIVANFSKITSGRVEDGSCGRETAEEHHTCKCNLQKTFETFADLQSRSDGAPLVSKANALKWFGQAGLLEAVFSKSLMIVCFEKIASQEPALSMTQFEDFIALLSKKSEVWSYSDVMRCLLECENLDPNYCGAGLKESPTKHGLQSGRETDTSFESSAEHVDREGAEMSKTADLFHAVRHYLSYIGYHTAADILISKRDVLEWFLRAEILGKHIGLSTFLRCYQDVAMTYTVMNSEEVLQLIHHVAREILMEPNTVMAMLLECKCMGFQERTGIPGDYCSGKRRQTPQEAGDSSNSPDNNGLMYFPFPYDEEDTSKHVSLKERSFASVFKRYSKLNNPRSTGLLISKWNALLWFQDAGLLTEISPLHVLDCFQHVAQKDTVLNREGFEEVVNLVRFRYSRRDLLRSLIRCGKPDPNTAKQKISELMARCLNETRLLTEICQPISTF